MLKPRIAETLTFTRHNWHFYDASERLLYGDDSHELSGTYVGIITQPCSDCVMA